MIKNLNGEEKRLNKMIAENLAKIKMNDEK